MHKRGPSLHTLFPLSRRLPVLANPTLAGIGRRVERSGGLLRLLFLLLCLGPSFASAQVSATLSGIVTDQSRAAVPAASVAARNLDTGLSRETVADQAGRYQLFALPLENMKSE
jgi:hypothetical protein